MGAQHRVDTVAIVVDEPGDALLGHRESDPGVVGIRTHFEIHPDAVILRQGKGRQFGLCHALPAHGHQGVRSRQREDTELAGLVRDRFAGG